MRQCAALQCAEQPPEEACSQEGGLDTRQNPDNVGFVEIERLRFVDSCQRLLTSEVPPCNYDGRGEPSRFGPERLGQARRLFYFSLLKSTP